MIAVATVLALVAGGMVAMTSVSNAAEGRRARCGPQVEGAQSPTGERVDVSRQNGRVVRNHWGDGQERPENCQTAREKQAEARAGNRKNRGKKGEDNDGRDQDQDGQDQDVDQDDQDGQDQDGDGQDNDNTGEEGDENAEEGNNEEEEAEEEEPPAEQIDEDDIIAENCDDDSNLQPHDGFQNGNRCVDTEMGEVGNEDRNPSLLITDFPEEVQEGEDFQIRVSTRNLIRDRFLAAGQGGYYVEMSKLNEQGLVRGHFHTACRILNNDDEAPDPQPAPAFFVATEDGGGGAQPDEIVIEVPGLEGKGTFQCASWAGDGSHRLPMMQRANQTPAFDAVRIEVQ